MRNLEGKVQFVIFCITIAASILFGFRRGKQHG